MVHLTKALSPTKLAYPSQLYPSITFRVMQYSKAACSLLVADAKGGNNPHIFIQIILGDEDLGWYVDLCWKAT